MRGGARRALVVGAAIVAATAPVGAGADVRPISLDGCSTGCGAEAVDDLTAATGAAESEITFSLCARRQADRAPGPDALVFNLEGVPAALVSGLPSPIAPDGTLVLRPTSPLPSFDGDAALDTRRLVNEPAAVAAGSFILSSSLVGRLTLGEILSYLHAVFARTWPL